MDESKKDKYIEKIYSLIKDCEERGESQRSESISLLEKAFSLYEELRKEEGKIYCSKHCSDIPHRMGNIVDRLIDYNS